MISQFEANKRITGMTAVDKAELLMLAGAILDEHAGSAFFTPHPEGLGERWRREGINEVLRLGNFCRDTATTINARSGT